MSEARYRLEERIGGGGMAEVFRGSLRGAEGFSRPVAVKRVLPGLSEDPAFAEMFKSEARIASLLLHPNIVSVIDFARDEDRQLFLVMELVDGKDLQALQSSGPIPVPIAAFIAAEVLRGLAFAHGLEHEGLPMRIVHRDVSPHNILVSWDGAVKLGDFGIAKAVASTQVTQSGMIKGKAAYLSPEQIALADLDGRSDLFALGIVLHEMLAARRLFGGREGGPDPAIVHRVLNLPIARPRSIKPEISQALEDVCLRLLERDRDRRFPNAEEALDALLSCPELSARGPNDLRDLMRSRFSRGAVPQYVPESPIDASALFPPPASTPSPRPVLPYGGFSQVDVPPPPAIGRPNVPSGETQMMAPPANPVTPTAWISEVRPASRSGRRALFAVGFFAIAAATAAGALALLPDRSPREERTVEPEEERPIAVPTPEPAIEATQEPTSEPQEAETASVTKGLKKKAKASQGPRKKRPAEILAPEF